MIKGVLILVLIIILLFTSSCFTYIDDNEITGDASISAERLSKLFSKDKNIPKTTTKEKISKSLKQIPKSTSKKKFDSTYTPFKSQIQKKDLMREEYNGFIIELKEDPVLKLKSELKLKGSDSEISSMLYNQRNKILNQQTILKEDVKKILGRSPKILGDFKNTFNGIAFDISLKETRYLKSLKNVKKIHLNLIGHTTLMDSVPQINADDAWRVEDNNGIPVTGEGITIAIIDTGIDYTHPDFGNCERTNNINDGGCEKVIGGYDFINDDNDPMDDDYHGTHVAGIAAGDGVLQGVAPSAKLVAYKVCGGGGSCQRADVISALERAVDPNDDGDFSDKLDVVSMSLNFPGNSDSPTSLATDNLVLGGGVTAVIASGNDGPNPSTLGEPGSSREALTVGAVDKQDGMADFSSRGPAVWSEGQIFKPDVVAPGVLICSARLGNIGTGCFDDRHVAAEGTSMAAPHVTGLVALLLQKYPSFEPQEIKNLIMSNAIDLSHDINTQGTGRIDALSTLNSFVLLNPGIIKILSPMDEQSVSSRFSVKNLREDQIGIRVRNTNMLSRNNGNEYNPIFDFSEEEFCLNAGAENNLEFNFNVEDISMGKYFGRIVLDVYEDCNFNEKVGENQLPVYLERGKEILIRVESPQWFSPNEDKEINIYQLKQGTSVRLPVILDKQRSFEQTFFTTDNLFDLIAIIDTTSDEGKRFTSMIEGVDLRNINNAQITFNEEEAQIIETNIEEILAQENMKLHFISIGTYIGESVDQRFFFEEEAEGFNLPIFALSETNPIGRNYKYVVVLEGSPIGFSLEDSNEILVLPLYFESPFVNLRHEVNELRGYDINIVDTLLEPEFYRIEVVPERIANLPDGKFLGNYFNYDVRDTPVNKEYVVDNNFNNYQFNINYWVYQHADRSFATVVNTDNVDNNDVTVFADINHHITFSNSGINFDFIDAQGNIVYVETHDGLMTIREPDNELREINHGGSEYYVILQKVGDYIIHRETPETVRNRDLCSDMVIRRERDENGQYFTELISSESCEPFNPSEECTDTDGGRNYRGAGVVHGIGGWGMEPLEYIDGCVDETTLKEFYCSKSTQGTWATDENYDCSSEGRICQNGACVVQGRENQARVECGEWGICDEGKACALFRGENACVPCGQLACYDLVDERISWTDPPSCWNNYDEVGVAGEDFGIGEC